MVSTRTFSLGRKHARFTHCAWRRPTRQLRRQLRANRRSEFGLPPRQIANGQVFLKGQQRFRVLRDPPVDHCVLNLGLLLPHLEPVDHFDLWEIGKGLIIKDLPPPGLLHHYFIRPAGLGVIHCRRFWDGNGLVTDDTILLIEVRHCTVVAVQPVVFAPQLVMKLSGFGNLILSPWIGAAPMV